ncbi:hypothetical protein SAMN06265365_1901, partial [Tistlia consotensis]
LPGGPGDHRGIVREGQGGHGLGLGLRRQDAVPARRGDQRLRRSPQPRPGPDEGRAPGRGRRRRRPAQDVRGERRGALGGPARRASAAGAVRRLRPYRGREDGAGLGRAREKDEGRRRQEQPRDDRQHHPGGLERQVRRRHGEAVEDLGRHSVEPAGRLVALDARRHGQRRLRLDEGAPPGPARPLQRHVGGRHPQALGEGRGGPHPRRLPGHREAAVRLRRDRRPCHGGRARPRAVRAPWRRARPGGRLHEAGHRPLRHAGDDRRRRGPGHCRTADRGAGEPHGSLRDARRRPADDPARLVPGGGRGDRRRRLPGLSGLGRHRRLVRSAVGPRRAGLRRLDGLPRWRLHGRLRPRLGRPQERRRGRARLLADLLGPGHRRLQRARGLDRRHLRHP